MWRQAKTRMNHEVSLPDNSGSVSSVSTVVLFGADNES